VEGGEKERERRQSKKERKKEKNGKRFAAVTFFPFSLSLSLSLFHSFSLYLTLNPCPTAGLISTGSPLSTLNHSLFFRIEREREREREEASFFFGERFFSLSGSLSLPLFHLFRSLFLFPFSLLPQTTHTACGLLVGRSPTRVSIGARRLVL